jgi:hypothetical protein
MGAGAVAAAGLITSMKTIPPSWPRCAAGFKDSARAAGRGRRTHVARPRHEVCLAARCSSSCHDVGDAHLLPGARRPHPPRQPGRAVFVVVFGFLFVTVSSRIVGLIGTSSNPISGMAIATLMATCALFLAPDWTARGLRRPRHQHRRRRLHRLRQRRQHVAGPEDGLSGGRDPAASSRSPHVGVLVSVFVDRLHPDGHEPRAREVPRTRQAFRRRSRRGRRAAAQFDRPQSVRDGTEESPTGGRTRCSTSIGRPTCRRKVPLQHQTSRSR